MSTPANQINLGFTITSIYYVFPFFFGLFLISIALLIMGLRVDYSQGNQSKQSLCILAFVGLAMILFSLWTTVSSFYGVVARIEKDIKLYKDCSLFSKDNPKSVITRYRLEYEESDRLNGALANSIRKSRRERKDDEGPGSADLDV